MSSALPKRLEIIQKLRLANDQWISTHGGDTAPNELSRWNPAAYYTGNQRVFEITAEDRYRKRAEIWAATHGWKRGPEGLSHADAHCVGQTYIDLYRIHPRAVCLDGVDGLTGIKPTMDFTVDNAQSAYDDWWWIDAFYMAGPVLAKLDATSGETEGRNYSETCRTMYLDMRDRRDLFDDHWGLWYRDANSKTATTQNGFPEFWGRGNGWVIAGLARVLDELGPAHADWDLYASMLRTMSAALLPLQQADGFWRASLADPLDTRWPNPETSGTAFIAYAMAWGINHGVLDDVTYRPVVARAWNGMVQTALHPNGVLGYVQGVGRSPAAASYSNTADFGVGAFLLAGSELSLMAEGVLPDAGAPQWHADFDGDHYQTVTLDASGTIIPAAESISSYEWIIAGNVIAAGASAEILLAAGTHAILLKLTDDQGNTYGDFTTITIQGARPPVPRAGPPRTAMDHDADGHVRVLLDGTGSLDPDGRAVSHEWLLGDSVVMSGISGVINLPLGSHNLTLRITDSDNIHHEDSTTVTVAPTDGFPLATASTYQNVPGNTHPPWNTLDGELTTRWSALGNQWIRFDLGVTMEVQLVRMAFYNGDQRDSEFSIDVSQNGITWREVRARQRSTQRTLALQDFDFPDSPARYVRINGFGNSVSDWNSITEVEIVRRHTIFDGNNNHIPDAWEETRLGGLLANNHNSPVHLDAARTAWIWGIDPLDINVRNELSPSDAASGGMQCSFMARAADGIGYTGLQRRFTIESSTTLARSDWQPVPGYHDLVGDDLIHSMPIDQSGPQRFYRLMAWLVAE